MTTIEEVKELLSRVKGCIFGMEFKYRVEYDNVYQVNGKGRIFIQIIYTAACNKTGEVIEWFGGKWYLSDHMTSDEIIKKAWCAYQSVITHEMMETFLVDDKILFNPHTNFEALLIVSDNEIKRL